MQKNYFAWRISREGRARLFALTALSGGLPWTFCCCAAKGQRRELPLAVRLFSRSDGKSIHCCNSEKSDLHGQRSAASHQWQTPGWVLGATQCYPPAAGRVTSTHTCCSGSLQTISNAP